MSDAVLAVFVHNQVQVEVVDQELVSFVVVGLVLVLGMRMSLGGTEALGQGLAEIPEDGWLQLGDHWGLTLGQGHSSRQL